MRRIAFLSVLALTMLSCSSDSSDSNSQSPDSIVAKWRLTKEVFYNTSNAVLDERLADDCENESSTEYKSDNTISFITYSDNGSGNCTVDVISWEYANWHNLGNSSYNFTSKISGQNEESYTNNVEFQNSNTMVIRDNSGGVYNTHSYSYSKEFYTKI